MPRPRFQNLDPARRRALLDAATRGSKAYESASINRILEDAGFSKGAFYHYFDDKADLAATVALEAYERPLVVLRELRTPTTAAEFWEEQRRINLLMTERIEADRSTYDLMVRLGNESMQNPDLLARIMAPLAESAKLLMALWEQGQAVGAVRTDVSRAELSGVLSAMKQALWKARFSPTHIPSHDEITQFVTDFLELSKRVASP
jgi:AcrR family transcriptional regulator